MVRERAHWDLITRDSLSNYLMTLMAGLKPAGDFWVRFPPKKNCLNEASVRPSASYLFGLSHIYIYIFFFYFLRFHLFPFFFFDYCCLASVLFVPRRRRHRKWRPVEMRWIKGEWQPKSEPISKAKRNIYFRRLLWDFFFLLSLLLLLLLLLFLFFSSLFFSFIFFWPFSSFHRWFVVVVCYLTASAINPVRGLWKTRGSQTTPPHPPPPGRMGWENSLIDCDPT